MSQGWEPPAVCDGTSCTRESLAGHPASMTHASIPKAEREKSGVTDALIRLSVGIEDIHDLIADLDRALNGLGV